MINESFNTKSTQVIMCHAFGRTAHLNMMESTFILMGEDSKNVLCVRCKFTVNFIRVFAVMQSVYKYHNWHIPLLNEFHMFLCNQDVPRVSYVPPKT